MRPIPLLFAFCLVISSCLAQESAQLLTLNGAKQFVSAKGEGEAVLVIHGGPGLNHAYFVPYLEGLEKDYRVIYFDQRASGKSSTPHSDSISIKFLTDDIEAIRKHFKITKLNILAHSWGAVLAVSYASDYRENVRAMILSNPAALSREYDAEIMQLSKKRTSNADSAERAKMIKSGLKTSTDYEQLMKLTFKMSAFNRANIDKLNLNIPDNFAKANQALFGGLMRDPAFQKNFYNELKNFNFPVLIIRGAVDIESASALHRLRSSLPNSRTEVFTESGHFPFVEETKKFNRVASQFLKKRK